MTQEFWLWLSRAGDVLSVVVPAWMAVRRVWQKRRIARAWHCTASAKRPASVARQAKVTQMSPTPQHAIVVTRSAHGTLIDCVPLRSRPLAA